MNLYTPEVREYVHNRPWPKGLLIDVYEDDEPLPHLNFVFYRDNWLQLSSEAHVQAALVVKEVMEKLRKDGIPCYMGKMETAPR